MGLFYAECPNIVYNDTYSRLFLAGGIVGCEDWQSELCDKLTVDDVVNLAVLNPRRKEFPFNDERAGVEQIKWEYDQLEVADAISFWFSNKTLQPIAMFELGRWSFVEDKPIFVGVHPNYERRFDVIEQLKLVRPNLQVVNNLDDLANQIISWNKFVNHTARNHY